MRILPQGEANTDIILFTEDFGKITVRAQSSRKITSTMRMHITRFNYVHVDVVRGKYHWILTGITSHDHESVVQQPDFLRAWYRISSLAEHLIRGEESHPELFDFFVSLYHSPVRHVSEGIELFGVVHVLDMLGYWHGSPLDRVPTQALLDTLVAKKKIIIPMINSAIEATQIVV